MKKILGFIVLLVVVGFVYALTSYESAPAPVVNDESNPPGPPISVSLSEDAPAPVTITLEAGRFTYTPNVVRVKSGQNVTLVITNIDTAHGIRIPALNISGTKAVNFIAPAPGTYPFSCPTMCGSGHREMKGMLVVE